MVFPCSVAPAASNDATAGAEATAGLCAFNQSGLPPPVRVPATAIRSLTANVSPFIGPADVGATASPGPGTNAPEPAAAASPPDVGSVKLISRPCTLAERGDHGTGIGDEAKTLFDVPDG